MKVIFQNSIGIFARNDPITLGFLGIDAQYYWTLLYQNKVWTYGVSLLGMFILLSTRSSRLYAIGALPTVQAVAKRLSAFDYFLFPPLLSAYYAEELMGRLNVFWFATGNT